MGDDLSRGEEPTRVAQGTQLQGSNLREIVPCGRSYICSKAIAISTILTSLANQPSLASAAESRLTIGAIWAYRSLFRFWKAARAWARAPGSKVRTLLEPIESFCGTVAVFATAIPLQTKEPAGGTVDAITQRCNG